MTMMLGVPGSYIELTPDYSYTFTKVVDRQDIRTKQGGLYTYLGQGSYRKFSLPLSWVSTADRAQVNSWWETATELQWKENGLDFPSSLYTVRITGGEEPFQTFVEPYFQVQFSGTIILETV